MLTCGTLPPRMNVLLATGLPHILYVDIAQLMCDHHTLGKICLPVLSRPPACERTRTPTLVYLLSTDTTRPIVGGCIRPRIAISLRDEIATGECGATCFSSPRGSDDVRLRWMPARNGLPGCGATCLACPARSIIGRGLRRVDVWIGAPEGRAA